MVVIIVSKTSGHKLCHYYSEKVNELKLVNKKCNRASGLHSLHCWASQNLETWAADLSGYEIFSKLMSELPNSYPSKHTLKNRSESQGGETALPNYSRNTTVEVILCKMPENSLFLWPYVRHLGSRGRQALETVAFIQSSSA